MRLSLILLGVFSFYLYVFQIWLETTPIQGLFGQAVVCWMEEGANWCFLPTTNHVTSSMREQTNLPPSPTEHHNLQLSEPLSETSTFLVQVGGLQFSPFSVHVVAGNGLKRSLPLLSKLSRLLPVSISGKWLNKQTTSGYWQIEHIPCSFAEGQGKLYFSPSARPSLNHLD